MVTYECKFPFFHVKPVDPAKSNMYKAENTVAALFAFDALKEYIFSMCISWKIWDYIKSFHKCYTPFYLLREFYGILKKQGFGIKYCLRSQYLMLLTNKIRQNSLLVLQYAIHVLLLHQNTLPLTIEKSLRYFFLKNLSPEVPKMF